jgi:hypothetical protein
MTITLIDGSETSTPSPSPAQIEAAIRELDGAAKDAVLLETDDIDRYLGIAGESRGLYMAELKRPAGRVSNSLRSQQGP